MAKQVLGEIVEHAILEIGAVMTSKAVSGAREDDHLELLAGTNQGFCKALCVGGVYVVVNFTVNQQETPFEIWSDLCVCWNS